MRIERKIKNYIVFSGDSILDAMKKINSNNSRIAFVVNDGGVLLGSVSDGDFRRWITNEPSYDLNVPVDRVMNDDCVFKHYNTNPNDLLDIFSSKYEIIPLVDDSKRFVSIARKSGTGFDIGSYTIDSQSSAFLIAEIGNNHNGDIELAKKLVELAKDAGADCVKFQMRDLESLYKHTIGSDSSAVDDKLDLGSQYTVDILKKFQLTNDELIEVFDHAKSIGIMPLCTPWDLASLYALEAYGMPAYKIASADLTNNELLEAAARTQKPLICSTGMSTEAEIKSATKLLRGLGAQFALLHCNSTYPTPFKDVNLNYLSRLRDISGVVVGYSGHDRGTEIAVSAVALGAKIIEKHFTVDREMEGNDHKVSLLPHEFKSLVDQIRNVETALGNTDEREITQGEFINRENLAKSLVVKAGVEAGERISRDTIGIESPGYGLQPNRMDEVVGAVAKRKLDPGDVIFESDIYEEVDCKRNYEFKRPYGIPVRFHDYNELVKGINVDFVEFHLSYHDLELDPGRYLQGTQPCGYAVHCPELFKGDHILDLASESKSYRSLSVDLINKVIDCTHKLKDFFPCSDNTILVVNAGGWNKERFYNKDERMVGYQRVADSLRLCKLDNIDVAIQTMPPFPWHFGGQSHHNLFVDPQEIVDFCDRTGFKVCLDVSHSVMACNYYNWSFGDFLDLVLPHTIHLHIVDASGVDGEGVQMGKGDVNFAELIHKLDKLAPNVPFIPEVWQGHKDNGSGFWKGLDFLEKSGL